MLLQPADDERLVQLQRDLLRKAALVQLELRADDDDGAGRVVDALAEQVFAEATLLALDHVRQRLQRTVAAAQHRAAAAAVVEQRIDGLLEHPLFVADDDFRSVEVDELLQTVVAVDDAAVQVVEVRRGEVAALQQHERAQVRRDHGDHVHDHPLGLVLRTADRLDQLQPLREILDLLLRVGLLDVAADLVLLEVEVEQPEELLDGLSAHLAFEFLAVLLVCGAVLVFGQELLLLQRRLAGVGDDVVLEVDDLLDVARLHVQQGAEPARQRLEEPDVHDRRGQVDVAHALPADARVRDLDAAAVADDALVLRALVLAARAFPVALGPEDALAEQAVFLGAVRAVVDRLGLLHLAERPRTNVVRAGELDADGAVIVNTIVDGFSHDRCSLSSRITGQSVTRGW